MTGGPSGTILALDQSVKRSGWAVFEPRPLHQFRIRGHGWFGAHGADNETQVNAFIDQVDQLVLDYGPSMLVWEKPSAFAGARGVNARTLVLTRIDQALRDLAKLRRIGAASVAASTWRAKVLGKGAGRFTSEQAKAAALTYWRRFHIDLKVHDEAEAMCIAVWACTCLEPVA